MKYDKVDAVTKQVTLSLPSGLVVLIGLWTWDAESDAIFCSHVMSFPPHFEGTKGLIHPDDLAHVNGAVALLADMAIEALHFRMITTYGEVKSISGRNITMAVPAGEANSKPEGAWEEALLPLKKEKEAQFLRLRSELSDLNEKLHGTGTWLSNKTTGETWYSDGMFRIHGLPPQSLNAHAHTFSAFIDPEDRPTVLDFLEKAYAEEKVQGLLDKIYKEHLLPEVEYRIIRPDGKQRYLQLSGKLSVYNGKELVMIGVAVDVTAHRVLQQSVREANEATAFLTVTSALAEGATATGTAVWLEDGTMHWSDGFYRLLGYRPKSVEPLFQNFQKSVHPEDLKAFKDAVTLALNGMPEANCTFRIISKSGMRRLQLFFEPLPGEPSPGLAGVVRDVSAQVALEQQAATAERFTHLLEDSSKDIIIYTNADNAVLSWNAEATAATGIKKEDALNQNLFELFPALLDEDYLAQLQTALAGQKVTHAKARRCYLPGSHSYQLSPFKDEQGAVMGILHQVRDISRELDLQQQLSERVAFIENLLDATIDRIVVLDSKMNYLYWNPKAEQHYAMSKQRVLGKNILEVFPGFRNDPSYQEFRRALKGETVYIPAKEDGGEAAYSETYLIPVKDEEGAINAVLWIVHDLTKEREYQQQLQEHLALLQEEHRRLNDAQAVGKIGSFEWNIGEDEVAWSDEMYLINGMVPQSKKITIDFTVTLVHPDDRPKVERLKEISFHTPGVYQVEHRVVLHDGTEKQVAQRFESIADEGGNVVRVHGTVQDVTEQKKAAAELEKSLALLQHTEDLAQMGSWEYEIQSGTFSWSEGMYALFGKKTGEPVQPEIYLELATPADVPVAQKIVDCLRKNFCPFEETLHIAVAGTEKIIRIKATMMPDADGKPLKMIGIDLDITSIRQAEAKAREVERQMQQTTLALNASLQQKAKELETKNEEITSFSFVASHDLKEPLRKILTFTNLLLNDEQEHSERTLGILQRMALAVKHLEALNNDMLQLTRLHAEEAEAGPTDLNLVLQQVLAQMQESIAAKGAVVEAGPLPVINGYATQVAFLLKNLISNALKFQPPGAVPKISIQAQKVAAPDGEQQPSGSHFWKLAVSDNGIGIDPKYKNQIFSIFKRLHAKDAYGGTGMGLAICRKVMENHHGFIDVESEVGKGATFCCYFPA